MSKGHEVSVYCRGGRSGLTHYKGAKLLNVSPVVSSNKFLDDPCQNLFTSIHSLFQDADILHFFGTDMLLFALMPRLQGKTIVFTVDGLEWRRTNYPVPVRAVLRSYAGLSMVAANTVIVDNLPALDWYRSHFSGNYEYLPYGAAGPTAAASDTDALTKFGVENPYAVYVGRLVPERGAHLAVNAFREIKNGMGLVVVGDATKDTGGYVSSLKDMATDNTIFTGFVYGPMMEQLLYHSSVYVHPSIVEGTSISLLTAMAFGKCIVASDISENRHVLGDAGEYFEPNNPRSLAAKVQEIVSDPGTARVKSIMAKERVKEHFDWSVIVDRLVRIYEAALRSRSRETNLGFH